MSKSVSGKLKTPVEIQHLNGQVTLCFVFLNEGDNLYHYIASIKDFIPVMLLSNEMIYIAKTDIKAFRAYQSQKKSQMGNVWSFDPYTVLNIDKTITLEDLHHEYILTLKKVHPDIIDDDKLHPVFKDVAAEITRRIINAYEYIRAEKLTEDIEHEN